MCGIFAIYSKKTFHINFLIDILDKLKHRGKDSFGISFIQKNNHNIDSLKSITKFNYYDKYIYNNLSIAITHNRYSTVKNKSTHSMIYQAQPILYNNDSITFHLVHNGNINNLETFIDYDENLSDTQNIIHFFKKANQQNFENILIDFINIIPSSFSIIILFNNSLYVLRDSNGFKPLVLGSINNDLCVISEDCIDNFNKIRDINPGEILKINSDGYKTLYQKETQNITKCIFEYIYFMNEKSTYNNISVYNIRKKLGANLASIETLKFNKNNTIVVGSPNTAIPMGLGYAEYLNLEYNQVLKKEADCGRTFILKNQTERQKFCKKFIFDKNTISGKNIILVDDSLVRGNTIQNLSKLFYENGCKELHIRICSPEIKYPCYYGIDIPTSQELIINNLTLEQIKNKFNLTSIKYITKQKMIDVFDDNNFCCSCFIGDSSTNLEW